MTLTLSPATLPVIDEATHEAHLRLVRELKAKYPSGCRRSWRGLEPNSRPTKNVRAKPPSELSPR